MTEYLQQGMVIQPSMMTYKERLELQRDSAFAYTSMYSSSSTDPVWDRLVSDATLRQSRAQSARPYVNGTHPPPHYGTLSGFVTNTMTPASTYAPTVNFKSGQSEPVMESLHPMVAKRYKQKFPLDFMCAIRHDTETTNQTLRMLGTYHTDLEHAERLSILIPSGCPGGRGFYHPDVVQTKRPGTTEHPAWATTAERFGFSSRRTARPQTAGALRSTAAAQQQQQQKQQRPSSGRAYAQPSASSSPRAAAVASMAHLPAPGAGALTIQSRSRPQSARAGGAPEEFSFRPHRQAA